MVTTDRYCEAIEETEEDLTVASYISYMLESVWHAGLLHRMKDFGVSGRIHCFSTNRLMKDILNGHIPRYFRLMRAYLFSFSSSSRTLPIPLIPNSISIILPRHFSSVLNIMSWSSDKIKLIGYQASNWSFFQILF